MNISNTSWPENEGIDKNVIKSLNRNNQILLNNNNHQKLNNA